MLKDLLYIGVGTTLLAKDKVEEELNKLIEKKKLSKEDAKEFLENAKQKAQDEEEKFKQKIQESLEEVVKKMNLATKEDIQELKKLLEKE